MSSDTPFVVVLAAAASRVGQSTLAENLAVYLKGMVEDLPVGLISFDPGQDPAQTFALPGNVQSTATRFADEQQSFCLNFGQFGVEYLHATRVDFPVAKLRQMLTVGDFSGVLVIDAGPLDSPAAVAALHAADLVLTPVREAAGLAALSQIRRELKAGGGNDQMLWLIPALLQPVTSLEFLRFAAQERGCQVLDDVFCQDERLSQRTKGQGGTVLTRMPQGPVHRLFVQMAQLVLNRYKDGPDTLCRLQRLRLDKIVPSSAGRIELVCPLCQRLAHAQTVHYCESFPQRQRWLVHTACMEDLLRDTAVGPFWQTGQVAILRTGVEGAGLVPQLRLLVAEDDGTLLESLLLDPAPVSGWQDLLRHATNRTLAEQQPALVFIFPAVSGTRALSSKWRSHCAGLRKRLRLRLAPEL